MANNFVVLFDSFANSDLSDNQITFVEEDAFANISGNALSPGLSL